MCFLLLRHCMRKKHQLTLIENHHKQKLLTHQVTKNMFKK